ncbi:MAG: hypothetical protein FD163_2215 [Hyphomonadaceae bacterium]|nr:MAG: hypothetical protein FD128_2616 [Hyphomonadaceae bacterium]KAF0183495.1 MAG: hypothetical protein FD163_2215 [Hyphomonadaceae bacterium]
MTISRKIIGILAVSSIGLIALSASAQNANDDASRKTDAKKTSGFSWGVSQGNGYAGTQNQRKKKGSGNAKDNLFGPFNEVYISRSTDTKAPSTLPAGSNEWTPPNPNGGNQNVVTHNKHPETRAKAKTKSRRRN